MGGAGGRGARGTGGAADKSMLENMSASDIVEKERRTQETSLPAQGSQSLWKSGKTRK